MSTDYISLEHPSSIIKDESENCRMCLESSGEFIGLVSAFETTSAVLNFMEAYNFCTNLNAQPEDCLPKIVCMQCAENLKFVYEVISKAVQSDQLLREFLSKQLDTDQCKDDQEFEEVQVLEDLKEDIVSSDENSADNVEALIFMEEVPPELEDEDVIEPTNDYACGLCEVMFVTEEDLIQHIRTHEETTLSIQDSPQIECEETLQINESIKEELPPNEDTFSTSKVAKKSSETQFICEICGKCFTTKQKLKMHNLVHTNEKNFACELCPKRFKTIFRKRDHLKLHENIRTHECSFCKERFFSKHTLICHMRRHTGERPYKCEICGKTFTQSSIMKTHVAIHTGKTVECPLCFKKFSRPSHLILHQRNHTGERPYICHLCPNSYKQKSHLDRHLDTHNGVKHVCKICGKVYTKKSTLNTHMFVHADNKRFNCDVCEMRFPTKYKYLRHVKNGHKVTPASGSDGTLELEENSIDGNSQPKSN